jgi:uridine phosphorylase
MYEKLASAAILENKHYDRPSVFLPENLLREARRQKLINDCQVPDICLLDPDGDLASYLTSQKIAVKNKCWACYHSNMYEFDLDSIRIGIIPNIVGSAYAVLVAEQLFSSGCKFIVSITSAGIIGEIQDKKFALITEAVRDEGTSYHYLAPGIPSGLRKVLLDRLSSMAEQDSPPWFNAKSWTTDAPYRETNEAIEAMKKEGVCCVEMESAALYAFASVNRKNVICFAHLTNTMAQSEGDFEKGEHFGSIETLNLVSKLLQWNILNWA